MRAFFAPYGAWKGLAGEYLRLGRRRPALLSPWRPGSSPWPGRNSFVIARAPGRGRVTSSFSRIQAA